MSFNEVPWDRLATTDKAGNRIYLYPTDVQGRWKRRRTWLSVILILIFTLIPWLRIGGHQAVLLDISKGKFAIFGLTFWAHDAPLLFFIVTGAVISIAFVTAIWGRVWCGWACPQTVFVEQVFRRIERWIEGDSIVRKKLDDAPLSLQKVVKKSIKWILFTLFSVILSHSFLAYFIGTDELAAMMASSPLQSPTAFTIMAGIAALILFDFGWFREQFCTIVCPYGRFQSVLMDSMSSVVAYDLKRGEPRRGTGTPSGDCVNCYRCVQVCPTGIDIRRGVQLECIACTACIDACDDVMKRLKKPLGLIRYGNQSLADGASEQSHPWYKRSRAWVYLTLLLVSFVGLSLTLSHRHPIEFTFIRAVDSPYQEVPMVKGDGTVENEILNHFKVDLRNQTFEEQEITFSIDTEIETKGVQLVVSNHKPFLKPGESERADLFIRFPKGLLAAGKGKLPVQIVSKSKTDLRISEFIHEASLVGPLK